MICAWAIAFSNSATESRISSASIFLNTFTFVLAPARSNALALSYSQFVPGNTGINTVGCAILCVQIWISFVSYNLLSTGSLLFSSETVANTFSSGAFHVSTASFNEISVSAYVNFGSASTSPITVYVIASFSTHSAGTSATISPNAGANNSHASMSRSIFTPNPLPNAILLTAGITP